MSIRILSISRFLPALAISIGASAGSATDELAAQDTEPLPAVLITGTSSGIGLRMTEVLSQNGFFVYAGARKPEDLALLDAMENVKSVRLDVTIQEEIDAAVALIEAEGRGLYGLINNAGVAVMRPLIEMPEEEMDFLLDVNLYGPYRVTKAFADLLIESGGRVATTGSIAGIVTGPYSGAYSISKHGIEAFTDALAAELSEFGVQVAVIEPGNYKSQIVASMVKRMEATGYSAEGSRYPSMRDLIRGPLDRSQYDEPDDVALAALDFMSSDSPKRRYMVVPNQGEADLTLRQALREIAQLNQGHAFSHTRDELVAMLDDALRESPPTLPQESAAPSEAGLHEAIVAGDLASVQALLSAGADPNVKEPSGGSSPLITASMFGRTAEAIALIEAGADVNQRNDDGSTALITAAFMAHPEIVQALLDAGADKEIRNNAGSTALDGVEAPFEAVQGIYDYLGAMLGPLGLELDYDRIRETRPEIAAMLR
jgi:NAD(P)-dependent dehydrogenase (short-subunit alcohol dehydrogenase family)